MWICRIPNRHDVEIVSFPTQIAVSSLQTNEVSQSTYHSSVDAVSDILYKFGKSRRSNTTYSLFGRFPNALISGCLLNISIKCVVPECPHPTINMAPVPSYEEGKEDAAGEPFIHARRGV